MHINKLIMKFYIDLETSIFKLQDVLLCSQK